MASQRETQNRFRYTALDIVGYNAYLADISGWTAAQQLTALGLTPEDAGQLELQNQRNGTEDPATGSTCLYINDGTEGSNPGFTSPVTTAQWANAHRFGFEIQNLNKPTESSGGGYGSAYAIVAGWTAEQDPRGHLQYNFNGSYAKLAGNLTINISEGGFIEWECVVNTSASQRNIICGQDGRTDDGIWFRDNGGEPYPVFNIGSQVKTTSDWSNPNVGERHIHRFTRRGGRVYYSYDGVEHATSYSIPNFQFNFDVLGRGGSNNALDIGIRNLVVKETGSSPSYAWNCDEITGVWSVNSGIPALAFEVQNYDDSNWDSYAGTGGRALINGGNEAIGTSPTEYGWVVSGQPAYSIPADDQFHRVVWRVAPAQPSGEWGLMDMEVDGVVVQSGINWVDAGTNTPYLGLRSGSAGTDNRKSKHVYCQLSIFGDTRNFILEKEGFEVNILGGVIGSNNVGITIPSSADSATTCSIVEIALLGSTQVTITPETGTIDGQPTLVINPNHVGTIRRIYIIAESVGGSFRTVLLNTGAITT